MTQVSVSLPTSEEWQVGVCCESEDPIEPCLISLQGLRCIESVRLFLAPGAVVPKRFTDLPITCLAPELDWGELDLLVVSEMLIRVPMATAYLLIRGNTVLDCPGLQDYFQSTISASKSPGVIMLERRRGRETTGRTNVSSSPRREPRAVLIANETAREFLTNRHALETSETPSPAMGDSVQDWACRNDFPIHVPERDFVRLASESPSEIGEKTKSPICVHGTSLSIVVPTWNCGPYLRPCLRSLLDQTADAEVIVVDDASEDKTSEILSEFADRVQVICHDERRGANAARNTGLRRAVGDFVVMADADNEYAPIWLEKLLDAILSDPDIGVAYCGCSRVSEDGRKNWFSSQAWDLKELWYNNYIDMPSLVRREALPADGLVEGFRPFDDWRLWLDMASRGWMGKHVCENLYIKRVRMDSKTLRSKSVPANRAKEVALVRRDFAHLVGFDIPVAVVIPAHGCEDLTVRCLAHVADFSGVPFVIYYVDNGSPISVLDEVVQVAEERNASLRILRNSGNRGFTQAVNQGIEASGDANVLILNNDCFVGPNCMEILAYEMATNDRVAAIGPITCDRGRQSLQIPEFRDEARVDADILDIQTDPVAVASKLRQRHRVVENEVLAFFCTLLNREAIRRFGILDERFPSGLAADDEWCLRVRRHGWRTLLSFGAYAAHLHQSTFERLQIDRDALQQESKKLLRQVLAENRDSKG